MARLILMVLALVPVGCRAPGVGLDPFAFGRQTRVPPPPTNAVGNAPNTFYQPPPTLSPRTSGSDGFGQQGSYQQMPESTTLAAIAPAYPPTAPRDVPRAGNLTLSENDRLSWRDPGNVPSPVSSPLGTPRLLPPPDPVAAVGGEASTIASVSPRVRVRGFQNASAQDVRIPAELVGQDPIEVRQAARWQPRHDEPRR